jgi:hypothetical protein
MITAVVSLNVTKSDFDNNINNIKTKFISAVAAAAGVPTSNVIIGNVVTRSGRRRRRLLSHESTGIHIVTNIFGASHLKNLDQQIKKSGIYSEGHVWGENHQSIPSLKE